MGEKGAKMFYYTCYYAKCGGCNVDLSWRSQILVKHDNGQWENVVIWEQCYCIFHIVVFIVHLNIKAMQGALQGVEMTMEGGK
jgi:hypothetical protein